jgi:RNA polymerase sigma-70 factor, ECF subfamily
VPRAPISSIWPDGLSNWELQLAEEVVDRFLYSRPGMRQEREDLIQDCLEHWLRQRSRFDPSRGASPKTFMRRVLEHRLADVAARQRAAKRGSDERPLSLDRPIREGSPTALGEVLPASGQGEDDLLRAIAVGMAEGRLSPRQRAIARALADGMPKSELARHLHLARSTVYEELARIKAIYRDEGLDEFLP